MCNVSAKHKELLKIISEYDFRIENNQLYSSPVPSSMVETIKSNKDEIKSLVVYLEKGKSVNASSAAKILSKLELVSLDINDCNNLDEILLEDEFLYDKITIFWNEREAECYSSLDAKVVNKKGDYSLVYLYDSSLSKSERDATYVNYWLVNWKTRCVYKSCCTMSDEYDWKLNVFPALASFHSIDEVLKWFSYYSIYDEFNNSVNIADVW